MTWTDQDVRSFAAAQRERARVRDDRDATWRAEALAQATACAEALAHEFGATRVVLFGSVARGDARPGSDVDLLVDGVPDGRWFDAVARAMEVVRCAEVDLVPAARVHAHVAARIASEGKVLLG